MVAMEGKWLIDHSDYCAFSPIVVILLRYAVKVFKNCHKFLRKFRPWILNLLEHRGKVLVPSEVNLVHELSSKKLCKKRFPE